MLLKLWASGSATWACARDRLRDERGATAVEYALMVALIAIVVVGAVTLLGRATSSQFQEFPDKAGWT